MISCYWYNVEEFLFAIITITLIWKNMMAVKLHLQTSDVAWEWSFWKFLPLNALLQIYRFMHIRYQDIKQLFTEVPVASGGPLLSL